MYMFSLAPIPEPWPHQEICWELEVLPLCLSVKIGDKWARASLKGSTSHEFEDLTSHRTFNKGKTNIYPISHHRHSNMVDSHGTHGRWFVKTSSDCKAPAVRSMIMNTVVSRAVRPRYTPKKKKTMDLADSSSASSISMSSTYSIPICN